MIYYRYFFVIMNASEIEAEKKHFWRKKIMNFPRIWKILISLLYDYPSFIRVRAELETIQKRKNWQFYVQKGVYIFISSSEEKKWCYLEEKEAVKFARCT